MFYDYIRKQRSDEYIIRSVVRMYGGSRRLKMRQAFVVTTRGAFGLMLVRVHGALLFDRQILFHADHPVGVMMMGNNSRHQHDNVD